LTSDISKQLMLMKTRLIKVGSCKILMMSSVKTILTSYQGSIWPLKASTNMLQTWTGYLPFEFVLHNSKQMITLCA